MAAPAPLHADRGHGRLHPEPARRDPHSNSTAGRLTDGCSNSTPNFHLIDEHDPWTVNGLERQMTRLRRGMNLLIDSYAEEMIDADEFKPRLTGLKQRLERLRIERDTALSAHEAERSL